MLRRNKYGARKTVVDGITFDSKKEAMRYGELKALENVGQIANLKLQPRFDCVVNNKKICTYRADFEFQDVDGTRVIEDVKGFKTPVYRIKKKLVEALHGVVITEI